LRCFWDLEAQHSAIILIKSNFLCLAISLLYAIKVSTSSQRKILGTRLSKYLCSKFLGL
jgi:hypothetical protein